MKANDNGWPTFDGKFVNYPWLKKKWLAYRQTYHAMVSNDLAWQQDAEGEMCKWVCSEDDRALGGPGRHLEDSGHM